VNLSPRVRADYLLLIDTPTPRQCLEAFVTESGVQWCVGYQCVVDKAAVELPELPTLLKSLPPFLVAARVTEFLDGAAGALEGSDSWAVTGLLDE
jgi:hypothetical protein